MSQPKMYILTPFPLPQAAGNWWAYRPASRLRTWGLKKGKLQSCVSRQKAERVVSNVRLLHFVAMQSVDVVVVGFHHPGGSQEKNAT